MTVEKGWGEMFNALPIEKRREIIIYGIHDEILMLEREKLEAKRRCVAEFDRLDEQIDILRKHRDRVYAEMEASQ